MRWLLDLLKCQIRSSGSSSSASSQTAVVVIIGVVARWVGCRTNRRCGLSQAVLRSGFTTSCALFGRGLSFASGPLPLVGPLWHQIGWKASHFHPRNNLKQLLRCVGGSLLHVPLYQPLNPFLVQPGVGAAGPSGLLVQPVEVILATLFSLWISHG